MQDEMGGDILSCVVYARPGQGTAVAALIAHQPGAEVLAGIAESRLVVTLEDTPDARAADIMSGFNALPGVINTLLIYHCAADPADSVVAATPATIPLPAHAEDRP